MHGVMYLFAALTLVGGFIYGGVLVTEPLTRAVGVGVWAGALVSGLLFVAVGRILDDLHRVKVRLGLVEEPKA